MHLNGQATARSVVAGDHSARCARRRRAGGGWVVGLWAVCVVLLSGCGRTVAATTPGSGALPEQSTAFGTVQLAGHLFQSSDGGAHWAPAREPSGTTGQIRTFALSATTRWVASASTTDTQTTMRLAHTTDDGQTWQTTTLPPLSKPYSRPVDLRFLDDQHGWLLVDTSQGNARTGMLYRTEDGGTTWNASVPPFAGALTFRTATTGWLVGGHWSTLNDTLATTQDGGRTWQEHVMPIASDGSRVGVGSPHFFSSQRGMLPVNMGTDLTIYTTTDGGITWAPSAQLAPPAGVRSAPPVSATSGAFGWVVLGPRLYVTQDSGASWTQLPENRALVGASALHFVSARLGWALHIEGFCAQGKTQCGFHRSILRTTDGGRTWTPAQATGLDAVALP